MYPAAYPWIVVSTSQLLNPRIEQATDGLPAQSIGCMLCLDNP